MHSISFPCVQICTRGTMQLQHFARIHKITSLTACSGAGLCCGAVDSLFKPHAQRKHAMPSPAAHPPSGVDSGALLCAAGACVVGRGWP